MAEGSTPPVELVVKLTPAAATADSPQERSVRALMAELHAPLEPLHPSASDDELATWFVAHVAADEVDGALDRLSGCDGVDGAYAKPGGEPPEQHTDKERGT